MIAEFQPRPRLSLRVGARAAACAAAAVLLLGACAPRFELPGPPREEPRLTESHAVMADGAALPLRSWPVTGEKRAVMLALHGFNDYGNFIDAAARYFGKAGIKVYAYDQRGFGNAPVRGRWAGTAAMTGDLRTVAGLLRRRHAGSPLYLLGASMGGAVIMAAQAERPIPGVKGTILAAPAVWGRAAMPFYQRWALGLGARSVPWLTLTGRGLRLTPSDNREMLRALGRDPLVIKETRVDTIYGLVNLMDRAFASAPDYRAPALLLYGDRDDIIPNGTMERVFARLPAAAPAVRRIVRYPDGYHMLLRDLQAETVWRDIAAWIADPAAGPPSGLDAPPRPGAPSRRFTVPGASGNVRALRDIGRP